LKTKPDFSLEQHYFEINGPSILIAGVDEAGRGSLAGPVVAAAVIIPCDQISYLSGVDDSKKLSPSKRSEMFDKIKSVCQYSVGIVSHEEIDLINILEATKKSCMIAVTTLPSPPNIVLVDGNMKFNDVRFHSVVKGDQISLSIAAASIMAKVTRDRIMEEVSHLYPEYLLHQHKGYGSSKHCEAIKKYGATNYHRITFLKKIELPRNSLQTEKSSAS
jgi:ribonuclease HII